MVVAILLALKDVLSPSGNQDLLPAVVRGRNLQVILRHLKALEKSYPPPPRGRIRFCTRCNRENHASAECRATVSCDICHNSGVLGPLKAYKTHSTSKYLFNYWPLPPKDIQARTYSSQLTQVHLPSQSNDDRME